MAVNYSLLTCRMPIIKQIYPEMQRISSAKLLVENQNQLKLSVGRLHQTVKFLQCKIRLKLCFCFFLRINKWDVQTNLQTLQSLCMCSQPRTGQAACSVVHLYCLCPSCLFTAFNSCALLCSTLSVILFSSDLVPVMNNYEISFCGEHLGDLSCESEKSLGLIQGYLLLSQSKRGYFDTHLLSRLSEDSTMSLRLSKVS